MKKDPKIFLIHILNSIHLVERYTKELTKEQLYSSEEKQDLITRRLEIIGEATKNIPETFKKDHPEIPWQDIADMRNVLIHQYFEVDYDIVWKTIEESIPLLKKQIEALLSK